MTYELSSYLGDTVYCIKEKKAVVGDEICFDRAVFSGGSFYRGRSNGTASFEKFDRLEAVILKEKYSDRGQHTFTLNILKCNGEPVNYKTLIKGRNLYSNGLFRKKWDSESDRAELCEEKKFRSQYASEIRQSRRLGLGLISSC